jgi:hypothetical protein
MKGHSQFLFNMQIKEQLNQEDFLYILLRNLNMTPPCNVHDFNVTESRKRLYSFSRVEKQMPTVLHLQVKLAAPIKLMEEFMSLRKILM